LYYHKWMKCAGLPKWVLFLTALSLAPPVGAQDTDPAVTAPGDESSSKRPPAVEFEPARFDWGGASQQSFLFLTVQHGLRITQKKTRQEFGGAFFGDWARSVRGVGGWNDGDSIFTNYIAHPMQGGVSGFIQIQNDPRGRNLELGKDRAYWNSRLRALGWAAIYSTQFELGPYSESAIGNVGKKKGTGGLVDLVVTPTGGLGAIVAEDWLDRFVVRKLEERAGSRGKARFYRVVFNPQRGFANLLRGKVPWHRDTRPLPERKEP